jgi:predicted alpha-1,6-mannanase (GH76 family)
VLCGGHDVVTYGARRRRLRNVQPSRTAARSRRSLAARLLLLVVGAAALPALLAGCGAKTAGPNVTGALPAPANPVRPVTSVQARQALASFTTAFYVPANGRSYHHASTAGGRADFWKQAEMIEMVEDAYDGTGSPAYKTMVVDLLAGARSLYGRDWLKRRWNDDIMWMVIAWTRAYQITGDRQYLAVARKNFDGAYARGWSSDLGGGLWWTTDHTQKNVTTNCPASIAASLLSGILHDPSYAAKAVALYGWVRSHLYDPATGIVYDNISLVQTATGTSTATNPMVLSYNQGSFIGAADLLNAATGARAYYDDALRTLTASRRALSVDGVMHSESPGGNVNGGGFKGIFSRWAVKFTRDNHITAFDPWFRLNAQTAWANRDARGLIGQNWTRPTGSGVLFSFDCSSGVVLLEVLTAH